MLVSSEGIFLHQIRHTDRQHIVKIYTRQFGMLGMLMPATRRRGKSRMAFHPMMPVTVQFQLRANRSLCYLNEVQLLHPLHQTLLSPVKTAQMLFLAEILLKSIREEEQNEHLFDFLLNGMLLLEQQEHEWPDFHLKFLFDLSRFLGFYPADTFTEKAAWFSISDGAFLASNDDLCFDLQTSRLLALLLRTSYDNLSLLALNGTTRRSLLHALLKYYSWHLHSVKDLKTPGILEEVFR